MQPNNGFYDQWPPGQGPANRRFVPPAGAFGNVTPHFTQPQGPNDGPQYTVQFIDGQQHFTPQALYGGPPPGLAPLIPLSAIEDLQPAAPFPNGTFQDPFNRAYSSNVYEGFIPAPGRENEDEYPNLPTAMRESLYQGRELYSSDDEDGRERFLDFEEEMELRRLEDRDDYELDADYSEEDAEQDQGDPDEMELDEDFEDVDEQVRRKRGRPSTRGAASTRGRPSTSKSLTTSDTLGTLGALNISDTLSSQGAPSVRGSRGGRRGRPSSRGRGGHHGGESTRKKKTKKPKSAKGPRGPRAVADPGPEFKELQRKANDAFIARDYSAALESAQSAIQLNPEIFDAYNVTSEIYAAMGDEENSIAALIAGAPTKRDPGLWQFIIERIQNLDAQKFPEYTEDVKTGAILGCLNWIIELNNNYEARSTKLEIEARLGHSSKCVALGLKMLKTRKEKKEDPDAEVLKIIAMMGTSSTKQTKLHLERLITSFEEAIAVFTRPGRNPSSSDLDWEMINIYLDLLDRARKYDYAISRLKTLSRWKQGRRVETYWDTVDDDREFDIDDEPRRVETFQFVRLDEGAKYGRTLPLEIRVKLGLFRLQNRTTDFAEAMHHFELLEPDDHSPEALVWDYEDLFRIIADVLHGTGHDEDALRFYEPLLKKNSGELNLKSYIGIHTCYKNLEKFEKAQEIILILQKFPADNYDDLAILATFFESQGMWDDASQRAERIYRDKYGHKLKKLGFKAYDALRDYHFNQRKQARGRYAVKKSTVKRNRRILQKAVAEHGLAEDSDSGFEGRQLPSLSSTEKRPGQGFFRTKGTISSKAQIFLPFQGDEPQRSTIEGTDVPLEAVGHGLFRRKLDIVAREYADDLKAARQQHREIVSSFRRLDELSGLAEEGDPDVTAEVISITRELIEEFSTFDLFYSNKKEELLTYFRSVGNGDLWQKSALMILAVVANNVEDGETNPEVKEKPDVPPQDFWSVHFDKWCDAFGRYALLVAREGDGEQCFATIDIALQSNIFSRSPKYRKELQICRLSCALAVDNSIQASVAGRWLLKEFPFGSDLFRLYSEINRLCAFPDGYSTGASYKVLGRYIKTMDYALLTPEERTWFDFQDNTPGTRFVKHNVNIDAVSRVKDHDPALFGLYAHVLMCGGSYLAALNYYFRAYTITPEDPILNLSIGVAYVQHAMKRQSENRQYQIQQGLSFIYRYYELRKKAGTAIHCQEAEFNVGRMWHSLGLPTLALPAYERCVQLREQVRIEAEARGSNGKWAHEDFAYEAAFAMQSIHSLSGNFEAARKITEQVLVIE